MKLNKQIVSVTLASTMILSSTSMTMATNFDSNSKEVTFKESTKESIEEQLKKARSAVEKAEETRLEEDLDLACELVESLGDNEGKEELINKLEFLEEEESEISALMEMVNAVPISEELTVEDKPKVEEAISTYSSFTEEQKDLVETKELDKLIESEDVINKLEEEKVKEAEELKQVMSLLEKAEDTKSQEDTDIAKGFIDSLKESENKNELTDRLEATQKNINKLETDKKQANVLIEQINNIPESKDLNIENKASIKETIEAYNNLSEDQKALVESKHINKLLVAEDVINKLEEKHNTEAAESVDKLITDLNKSVKVEDITEKYISKADKARKAYDELNENAKSLVSESNIEKLEEIKTNVDKSKTLIKSVQDKIDSLSKDEDIFKNGELILDAKKSYDDLSDTAKRFISKESSSLLNKRVKEFKSFTKRYFPGLNKDVYEEDRLKDKQKILKTAEINLNVSKKLQMNQDRINYYEKTIDKAKGQIEKAREIEDKVSASHVDKLISELKSTESISQELITQTEGVRKAYNELNNNAKTKVSKYNLNKFEKIEKKVLNIKTSVEAVEGKIQSLSKNKDMLKHGEAILKAEKMYKDLSDEGKTLINEEIQTSLNEAIESFKSFSENDFINLSHAVSKESDFKKKQELINLTQANFNLIKELGIDEIKEKHYQSLIRQAQKQANAFYVKTLINELGEEVNPDELTEEYITRVKTIKRSYDALSPEAKAFIEESQVEKLERTDAQIDTSKQEAIDYTNELIENISKTDKISKELVDEIELAQNAYNSLNNEAKGQVSEENIEKLKGLQNIRGQIAELKKTIKPVEDRIALLPENKNMLAYGKAILKAKNAYDDLSDTNKSLVSEDSKALLNKASEDYKSFTKHNAGDLNKSVSNEIDVDKKQELVNIAKRSLDLSKQLGLEENEIKDVEATINQAQNQVDTVKNEISAKEVANRVDHLVSRFDEKVSLKDMTEDYISKVKIASEAYNSLNNDTKKLVSSASLGKLVRVEAKLANIKLVVSSVEDKISNLPENRDILMNYDILLETKKSYDNLADTTKNFIDEELELSLIKTIENFKTLTKTEIERLNEDILKAKTMKSRRSIVNKAPMKLERAKTLGMEIEEYDKYKSMIESSKQLVDDLEDKAINLRKATMEANDAIANLSEDVSIEDKEIINKTKVLVNKALSLDSNVKIEGIEKLELIESKYKELKKESILITIDSLNENNTEQEAQSMLQLLADTTKEFDINTVENKNLSRYLDRFKQSTIKTDKDVQGIVKDVNVQVAKLEEAMTKAEDAVASLPTLDNIRAEDKMQIVKAKALIESVKVFDENAKVKDQEKIAALDIKADELIQAKKVEDKINELTSLDNCTLENKPETEEVLEEYKNLTVYQQSIVENIDDLFSVKSELEEESEKSEQAMAAITKAKESNSKKDLGMAKALISTLTQEEDKETLNSKLMQVENKVNKAKDEETVARVKSELRFTSQINDVIEKPKEVDGVSFTLDVSNIKGVGLIRDAQVNSDGNIEITRELTTNTSFDMIVTLTKGDVTDTKVFSVVAEGDLWPGNSMTTIKVKD